MTGWLDGYVGIVLLLMFSGQMELIIHWPIHVVVCGEMNEVSFCLLVCILSW